MKKGNIVTIVFLCAYLLCPVVTYSVNYITDVSYAQGYIADTLILSFKDIPVVIYDPGQLQAQEQRTTVRFFLPLTTLDASCKAAIARLNTNNPKDYNITIKHVSKPTTGIEIAIAYNINKILLQYGYAKPLLEHKKYIIKWYHKNTLKALKQNKSYVRWFERALHQPRIVLDIQEKIPRKTALLKQLTHLLAQNGYEVIVYSSDFSSPEKIVSAANMLARPDLCIILHMQYDAYAKKPLSITVDLPVIPQLTIDRTATLSADPLARLIDVFNEHKYTQSSRLMNITTTISKSLLEMPLQPLKAYTLYTLGLDMPVLSLRVTINRDNKNMLIKPLVQALYASITTYMQKSIV